MRGLVDTHTFFWFVFSDPQLTPLARQFIGDPANEIYVSVASIWEACIKVSTGKLTLRPDPVTFFENEAKANDIRLLPIEPNHLRLIANLPFHHRDPFDRLIIAQSIVEGMPLLSADTVFEAYVPSGLSLIWEDEAIGSKDETTDV